MRRTLESLSPLLVALLVLGQNIHAAAEDSTSDEYEYELPDLAGDGTSRDFGGAADDVDMQGVVVTGAEGDNGDGEVSLSSGESHTVETGDTLWDLSSRYLGSPWYWPKVWSFNPQIENPHWIYPGDRIRLGDGSQQQVPEPASSGEELDHHMEDEVSIAGQIGYRGEGTMQIPSMGFLSRNDLGRAGTIVKSWEEKTLLYEGDRIYVEVRDPSLVRVGESVVIFRSERQVVHPLSGEALGYVTRILGSARWVQAPSDGKLAVAEIRRSVMEISRGDLLGPAGFANFRDVQPIANTKTVQGVIAGTLDEEIHELAAGHLVFLDKGIEDGVQTGNTMQVVRSTDGLADTGFALPHDEELPAERIGEVLVIESLETSSVGLVTRSARELRRGDRVVMNVASHER